MTAIEKVLAAIGADNYKKAGDGYACNCPAHEDGTASLTVTPKAEKVLIHCHAGCSFEQVLSALNLTAADLREDSGASTALVSAPEPPKRFATLEQAIAEMKPWNASTVNTYQYENGKPFGCVLRYDLNNGSKTFRQITVDGDTWVSGAGNDLWPLYLLNDIPDDGPVFLHEGEKAAHAGARCGLPSIASKGGSNAPKKTDWSPLAGREVGILPDNDDAGEGYAKTVTTLLHDLDPPAVVKIVRLDGRPPKGDIADLEENSTADEIRSAVLAVLEQTEPEPIAAVANVETVSMVRNAVELQNPLTHTEAGLAKRLIFQSGGNLRFTIDLEYWYWYDGKRWVEDRAGVYARRIAKASAHNLWQDFADLPQSVQKIAVQFVMKANQCRSIENTVKMASSEELIGIDSEDFDSDPWVLNCENGVLDLKDYSLRKHHPDELVTKLANVEFLPTAGCPKWRQFVDTITCGDTDLAAFLQRSFGLALSADQSEQAVWVHHGNGGNGKGVFLSVIHQILGDYAAPASVEAFIHKRSETDRARSVARLRGNRLVFAQETDDGCRLSEQAIKSFTGSDAISFRRLFKEEATTLPTWHIHLAVNERPQIRGTDIGIWRRVKLVPWNHMFTGAGQRPRAEVEAELLAERAGILNWLVVGLEQWRQHGLQEPDAVKVATNEYQKESDTLADWIGDECILDPAAITMATDLFVAYREWCKRTGNRPWSQTKFGRELETRGYRKERPTQGDYRFKTVRYGIGLNSNPNNWVEFEK